MSQKQKKPRKPWNEQTKAEKIATVVSYVIVMGFLGAIGISIYISNQDDARDLQVQNAQDTATAAVQAVAQATTQAAKDATKTVLALTPTATPTFLKRITDIVQSHKGAAAGNMYGTITDAAQTDDKYLVDIKEPDNLTAGLDRVEIQVDADDIMYALYNTSGTSPVQVLIRFNGNCTDKYGNNSTCEWAMARLDKGTAKLFNWKNLDYEEAWGDYDVHQYLVSNL
jgi:hypothetical protein